MPKATLPAISFVIPAYNASNILHECVEAISQGMSGVNCPSWEIVVVNDGSVDDTAKAARSLAKDYPIKLVNLKQNQGRFVARQNGVKAARFQLLFLIDTKVVLSPNAMSYIAAQLHQHPERKVWNGHVMSEQDNPVALFNEASVMLVWSRYLRNPRLISFGVKDFDYYPKGTGCLLLPKSLLSKAFSNFQTTSNLKHVSDDTRLLRYIVSQERIWLSPKFACTYKARNKLSQFLPWIYHRGIMFIDSYLHKGTRFYWPLSVGLVGLPVAIVVAVFYPFILVLPLVLWAIILMYLFQKLPTKHWWAVCRLGPLYVLCFTVGLYVGFYLRLRTNTG